MGLLGEAVGGEAVVGEAVVVGEGVEVGAIGAMGQDQMMR